MEENDFLKTEVMDKLESDGGLIGIFRTIACIGDSLIRIFLGTVYREVFGK